jgi:hypothetical protein
MIRYSEEGPDKDVHCKHFGLVRQCSCGFWFQFGTVGINQGKDSGVVFIAFIK